MKEKITKDTKKAAEFFLEKISFCASPFELKDMIADNINEINIIDVRAYDDYIDGHIPYAIHLPYKNIEEHLVMLEKDKTNIVYSYCPYCKLAHKVACYIAQKDYPVMVLNGGFKIWKELEYDIIKTSSNVDM